MLRHPDLLASVRTYDGRNRSGANETLYAIEDVRRAFIDRTEIMNARGRERLSNGPAPHTNAEGFIVIAGETWAHEKAAYRKTGVHYRRLRQYAAANRIRTQPGIGGQRKRLALYAIADIERIVREEAAARSSPRT